MSRKRAATKWERIRERRKRKRERMADYEKAMEKMKIVAIIMIAILVIFVIVFPDGVPWADPYAPKSSTTTSFLSTALV